MDRLPVIMLGCMKQSTIVTSIVPMRHVIPVAVKTRNRIETTSDMAPCRDQQVCAVSVPQRVAGVLGPA